MKTCKFCKHGYMYYSSEPPCDYCYLKQGQYPEKKDPMEEMLKMFDKSTPEERLMVKIREFASKPRIMALMPEVVVK